MLKLSFLRIITIIMLTSIISSCQTAAPVDPIELTQPSLNPEETITPTISPIPSETQEPKTLYLITNQSSNRQLIQDVTNFLNQYSIDNQFLFSTLDSFADVLFKEADILIFIETDTNPFQQNQQSNLPFTIVFVDQPRSTLENVIQIKQLSPEEVFLAGYVSAMIADDWRIGGILSTTSTHDTSYAQIFENGAHYLCGRCTPVYSPIVSFPKTASIDSVNNVMQAYAEIETSRTYVVFTLGQFFTEELITNLEQNSRTIVSNHLPEDPTQRFADIYIYQDYVSPLMQALKNNNSNETMFYQTDLIVLDHTEKISPGKENFLEETILKLENGTLSPYNVILPEN